MRRLLVVLTALAAAGPSAADDNADAALVKGAGLSADAPALIAFIEQRSRDTADPDELARLVKDLGTADAKTADAAAAALVARGPLAIPVLRRAANDLGDASRADRARKAIEHIEGRAGSDLVAAVARLVGATKADRAVDVLLAYLPYANDGTVLDAVGSALAQGAYPEGKAHPALTKALDSELPIQRATAAEALAKIDHPETRPAIARRLTDPARPVRRRVALALARVEDVTAVPVLVDLMGELPKAERTAVAETLRSLAGETAPKDTPDGDTEADRKALRDAWAGWWRKIDGPALVDEFRSRTLTAAEREKVADLVKRLGDGNYRVRERASGTLVSMGAKVLPEVRAATSDADSERARRAEDCVSRINASDAKRVPVGTARLTALRRPAGAAEAMLGYLPYADDDDGMVAEVKAALTTLALDPNGKPEPALVEALGDSSPVRRATAAEALAKGGGPSVRPAVKKLLADMNPDVRQATAVALAVAGETEAVPVLIDLLGDLPGSRTWPAQDILHQLAGDQAPAVAAGDRPEDRQKYRDAWRAWWKANAASTDLAKLSSGPGYLGYTLLIEVGNNSQGRVAEIGRDGKVRWQIGNLKYPVDAVVLPGEKVLITEWEGNRVGEWDFKGNLLWKKEGLNGRATNAQRLPTGNTFVCTTSEMLEVDRSGKTVYTVRVNQGLTAGYRAANGELVCLRNDGNVVRYDTSGKEIKAFPSNRDTSWTSGIDLTRGGNILVTQPSPNQKVTEYDPTGKVVKEWRAPNVTTATKMANGNILAASHSDQKVTEYDPTGKKVWEHKDEYHIFRARRR